MSGPRHEADDTVKFWRRTCVVLGTVLALSVATICALIAVLVLRTSLHQVELNSVRAQGERDREIVIKMWEVANDELNRLRQQSPQAPPHSK
jgi:hypothetical protein